MSLSINLSMANILFINTANNQEVIFILFKNKGLIKVRQKASRPSGGLVLKLIDRLLKKGRVSPNNLKAVYVACGPGSFSALRTGVVIANTLAKSLNIPVIGLKTDEVITDQGLLKLIKKKRFNLKSSSTFKPVVPFYGKEPNITMPKITLFK